MSPLKQLLALLWILLAPRGEIMLENVALRHQLSVLSRQRKRPPLRSFDRIFWVGLSRIWSGWRSSLVIVKPETVIGWHRKGFRRYWWECRSKTGRP